MVTVPSHEIVPQLTRLLALLRGGEEVDITEEGLLLARMVPVAATPALTEGHEDEDERPWRGVLAVARQHRQTQSTSISLTVDALPKRARSVGMAWHRMDGFNNCTSVAYSR